MLIEFVQGTVTRIAMERDTVARMDTVATAAVEGSMGIEWK
tara:strand:+ start:117 stop:239 length:123 start_codon:yes stop_codon:yes gene_type:complete